MSRRFLLVMALVLFLLPSLLFAQDSAPTIEFYGVIQGAVDGQIAINGVAIDVRGAQINAPIQLGTPVWVRATLGAGGQIIAQQIDRIPPEVVPGIVEVNSIVTGFTPTTITLGDQTFDTTNAQISGGIELGQPVRVFAISNAPGTWTALSVSSGVSGVIATPEVVAPGQSPEIAVPAATPEVVIPPPAATPEIIVVQPAPQNAAPINTPEVIAPAEDGEDIKIQGTLETFTDAYVVVDGQQYFIGGARIDGTLSAGVPVELELRYINGQWVLEEIKVVGGNSGSGGG